MNLDRVEKYTPETLSVVRIVIALLFLEHGSAKLLGFPPSPHGEPAFMTLMWIQGLIELFGGALLAPDEAHLAEYVAAIVAVHDAALPGGTVHDHVGAAIDDDEHLLPDLALAHRRFAGPAFLLNDMLVWGFTGQVISAMLDVAGWAKPWDASDVRELDEAMALVGDGEDA